MTTVEPEPNDGFVEQDPSGRFHRYKNVLGRGAFKTVYGAFDTQEALEVAWNKLNVERLSQDLRNKLENEVIFLGKLDHQNIIKLYDSFKSSGPDGIESFDFITELMMSGNLKEYLKKAKVIKLKVIRRWCSNILAAIAYIHKKGIMHRDLKLENLFVNGHVGEVKIGDLGLSAFIAAEKAESVIGTPEYMAPELYEESYTEKVDIYAFGMCLLEMVSMDYPYSECRGPAQIMKKACNNEKPAAFYKLVDSDVKHVVAQCLKREPERPSAEELQQHPLFRDWASDDGTRSNLSLIKGTAESAKDNPSLEFAASDPLAVGDKMIAFSETLKRDVYVAMEGHSTDATEASSEPGVVVEHTNEGPAFRIGITIPIQDLGVKLIEFTIGGSDDPRVLAEEMVSEFKLDPEMVPELTHEIEQQVSALQELREREQQHLYRSPGPPASSRAGPQGESPEIDVSESAPTSDDLFKPPAVDAQSSQGTADKSNFEATSSRHAQASRRDMSEKRQQEELPVQQPSFSESSAKATLAHLREPHVQAPPPSDATNLSMPRHANAVGEPSSFRVPGTVSSGIVTPSGLRSTHTSQHASDAAQGHSEQIRPAVLVSQGSSEEHGKDAYASALPEGNQAISAVASSVEGVSTLQVVGGRAESIQERDVPNPARNTVEPNSSQGHVLSSQQQSVLQPASQYEPPASFVKQMVSADFPESNSMRAVASSHPSARSQSLAAVAAAPSRSVLPSDSGYLQTAPIYGSHGVASSEGSSLVSSENVVPASARQEVRPASTSGQQNETSRISTPAQVTHSDSGVPRRTVDVAHATDHTHPFSQGLSTQTNTSSYAHSNLTRDDMHMLPTAFGVLPPPLAQEGGFASASNATQGAVIALQDSSNAQLPGRSSTHNSTHGHMVRPIVVVGGDKQQAVKRLPATGLHKNEANQNSGMNVGSVGSATTPYLASAAALADAHGGWQAGSIVDIPARAVPLETSTPPGSDRVESGEISRRPEGSQFREKIDVALEFPQPSLKERQDLTVDASRLGASADAVASTGNPVLSSTTSQGAVVAPSSITLQENINTRSNSQRSIYSDDSISQASTVVSPAQPPPAIPASSPTHSENEVEQQKFYLLCLELMDNVAKGRVAAVKQKLSQGASVTFADYDKRTPLHLAALYGDKAVCRLLLEHGADVNALDRWNRAPLQDARIHSHAEVVDILLKAGARDNEDAEDLSGIKMLQACAHGQLDTVRELIASNTPVTYKDYEGRTALHVACSQGHADIVDLLMLNGADAFALDGRNRTPVDNAVRNGHRHVLEVLKRNGAEIAVQAPVLDKKPASVSPRPSVRSIWGQSGGVHFDANTSRLPSEGMPNGNGHAMAYSARPKSTPPPDYLAEELDSMKSAVAISHSVSMGNIVIGSDGFALPTGAVTNSCPDGLSGSSDSLSHSHLSSQSLPASRFDASDMDGDVSVGDEKEKLIAEWKERRKRLDEEVQMKLEKLQPPPRGEAPSDHDWQDRRHLVDHEVQMKLASLQPPRGASSSAGPDLLQTSSVLSDGRGRVHGTSHSTGDSSSAALGFSSSEGLAALLPERDQNSAVDFRSDACALESAESSGGVVILPASSQRHQSGFFDPVYSSEGSRSNEKLPSLASGRSALAPPLKRRESSGSSDLDQVPDNIANIDVAGEADMHTGTSSNKFGLSGRGTREATGLADSHKIARGHLPDETSNAGMEPVHMGVKKPDK